MLILTTVAASGLVTSFVVSGRRYHSLLAVADAPHPDGVRLRASSVLRNRFVGTVFIYQVLSAAGSQLADFLAFDRAAARYAEAGQLAQFAGVLTVLVNIVDIAALVFVAGFLMTRLGLRYTLMANPAVVAMFAAGMMVTGASVGVASTMFFILAASTRILDTVFTDGTTRTSVNATFQAMPPGDRFAAQTAVEGIGVPVGLGLVGTVLIAFHALGWGTMAVTVTMVVNCAAWVVAGTVVFRGYRRNLAVRIRRREIVPLGIRLDDPETSRAIDGLITSGDLARVRLGFDLLGEAEDERLPAALETMLDHPNPELVAEALRRLRVAPTPGAVTAATSLVTAEHAVLRIAAAGVLCSSGCPEVALPLLADPDREVRSSAAMALRETGSAAVAAFYLREWARSADAEDRRAAARTLGGVAPLDDRDVTLMATLRNDPDETVQREAIEAAIRHPEATVVDAILNGETPRRLIPIIARFLVSRGERDAELMASGLRGERSVAGIPRWRLARACSAYSPEVAYAVVGPHLDDADGAVRHAARLALHGSGWRGTADDVELRRCLDDDRRRAVALLGAIAAIEPVDSSHLLVRGLRDALQAHTVAIAAAADLMTAMPVASRVARLSHSGTAVEIATAEEALEVTFVGERRELLVAMLRPGVAAADRLARLGYTVPALADAVASLIRNDGPAADPWLRVCAVWWLAQHPDPTLSGLVTGLPRQGDPVLTETAAAVLAAS
jgi:hypothetical protein